MGTEAHPVLLITTETKECRRCKATKPLNAVEFGRTKRKASGFHDWCKGCRSKYDRDRYRLHRDRILGVRQTYAHSETGRANRNAWQRGKKRILRLRIIGKLGGRCADSRCRWVNEDGSTGCTDAEILQIDHKHGGGAEERKRINAPSTYYKKILADTTGSYQLLCANCNWKKRYENVELFKDSRSEE